jgi:hypothetical protein
MFDDPEFLKYGFQDIPLDRDIYVMGEQWMAEYETAWREVFAGSDRSPYEVGYISYAAVRSINTNTIELSWFANVFDRFHEVTVLLPKRAFIICVQSRDYDDKPRLFVKDDWIDQLYLRTYSVFALVDAIGVKSALLGGRLTRNKLLQLRDKIDGWRNHILIFHSFPSPTVCCLRVTGPSAHTTAPSAITTILK